MLQQGLDTRHVQIVVYLKSQLIYAGTTMEFVIPPYFCEYQCRSGATRAVALRTSRVACTRHLKLLRRQHAIPMQVAELVDWSRASLGVMCGASGRCVFRMHYATEWSTSTSASLCCNWLASVRQDLSWPHSVISSSSVSAKRGNTMCSWAARLMPVVPRRAQVSVTPMMRSKPCSPLGVQPWRTKCEGHMDA